MLERNTNIVFLLATEDVPDDFGWFVVSHSRRKRSQGSGVVGKEFYVVVNPVRGKKQSSQRKHGEQRRKV